VQLTPLARLVGWARFTRQNASACWQHDNPQPSDDHNPPTCPALHGSAARALPGTCLFPESSTLQTPASGAADRCPLGGLSFIQEKYKITFPSAFARDKEIAYNLVHSNQQ